MASKRRRGQAEENASSRNLDGRRLRTVAEAKALTEYHATKPGLEKKAKEEQRKKWQKTIEDIERRREEMEGGNVKFDAELEELLQENKERTRKAVRAGMSSGNYPGSSLASSSTGPSASIPAAQPKALKIYGWDDDNDEEFLSSDDDENTGEDEEAEKADTPETQDSEASDGNGKGKAKAVSN